MSYQTPEGRWEYKCPICGRLFRRNTNHEGYCSHECALEARRRQHAARVHPTVFLARECEWCGETFVPHSQNHRYCSANCRVAAHRAREVTPAKVCPQCGTPFIPGRRDQQYCSHTCTVAKAHERARERRRAHPPVHLLLSSWGMAGSRDANPSCVRSVKNLILLFTILSPRDKER